MTLINTVNSTIASFRISSKPVLRNKAISSAPATEISKSSPSKTAYAIGGIFGLLAGLAIAWCTENTSAEKHFHKAKAQMIENCAGIGTKPESASNLCAHVPEESRLTCHSTLSRTSLKASKINSCLDSISTTAKEFIKIMPN